MEKNTWNEYEKDLIFDAKVKGASKTLIKILDYIIKFFSNNNNNELPSKPIYNKKGKDGDIRITKRKD